MNMPPIVPEPWNALEDLRALVVEDAALELLRASDVPASRVEHDHVRLRPGPAALVTLTIEGVTEGGAVVRVPGYALVLAEGRALEVAAKWTRMKPEPGAFGEGVRLLSGSRSVLFLFPNDRHLRGLRFIATMDKLKRTLTGLPGIGSAGWRVSGHRSELLSIRYKPEKRFIARVRMELKNDTTQTIEPLDAFLRFFPDDRGDVIHRLATTLRASNFGAYVPAPLGSLADGRLFVERAVPGKSLLEATLGGTADARAIVGTLSVLYALDGDGATGPSPAELVVGAEASVGDLTAALPDETARARRLLSGLENNMPPTRAESLIHGDLHPQQFIEGPHGLVLVDFERMAKGDPVQDLGNFLANLEALALATPDARASLHALRSALVREWTRVLGAPDPKCLAFYETLAMIELALLPLRRIELAWRTRVAARLAAAEFAVSGAGMS